MKKIVSPLVLLALLSSLFFTTCKKGQSDPAISLRTRKARVVGEWRIKSGNASVTIEETGAAPFNQAHQFDGSTTMINETESGNVAYIYKAAYVLTLKCKKDGSFELTENYAGKNVIASGKWNFIGGVGEAKNKESIVFVVDHVTSGYLDGHLFNKWTSEFTYKIVGLHNKEMILESGGSPLTFSGGTSATIETYYKLVQ
jgi:hypothetical protein